MVKKFYEKYHLIIGFVLLFIIGLYINEKQKIEEQKINAEIDNNLDFSIAKVKEKGRYFIEYAYYYGNNVYHGHSEGGGGKLVGRFFIVELSRRKPEISRIRLDKEIKNPRSLGMAVSL
ncbi:hypothetical protein [Flavobacterium covae]|uniref:hypothetical protein n=1 Tax=Flavobacterium covae TaxID=2906076 RepID=UPI0035E419A8